MSGPESPDGDGYTRSAFREARKPSWQGLSPAAGLYALLLPTVAYALLGSSRRRVPA